MDPTPAPTITLITCVPDGVYTHRFIARGTYTGQA
jgi:sortase (surface protein transpeptidase)